MAAEKPAEIGPAVFREMGHLVAGLGKDHLGLGLLEDGRQLLQLAGLLEVLEGLQPTGLLG